MTRMQRKVLATMRSTRYPKLRATLLGGLAIAIWGSTIAAMRSVVEQMGPLTSAAAANLIGGLVGTFILVASRGRLGRPWKLPRVHLLTGGATFILYNLSLYLAIHQAASHTQTVEIALVNYLWPALTLVFSVPLLQRKARATLWPGLILATIGICWALAGSSDISVQSFKAHLAGHPAPYVLALIAAIIWSLYSNLTQRWAGPEAADNPVPLFLLATGIFLLPVSWIVGVPRAILWTPHLAGELLYLSLLPTLLAYFFWDVAMREGNSALVVTLSFFIPLISTIISCLYLRVPMTMNLWLACALVIAGAAVCRRSISDSPVHSSQRDSSTNDPGLSGR